MRKWPLVIALILLGVAAADRPAFDVTSIKPNTTGEPRVPSMRVLPGGRFVATNITPRILIEFAYHVFPNRGLVRGAPSWLDTAHFDIEAKGPEGPDDAYRLMMQGLLEERFKLAVRRVTSNVPIYRLVMAKGAMKFQAAQPRDCSDAAAGCGAWGGSGLGLNARTATMGQVADFLSFFAERVVMDGTGLQGQFDMKSTGWASSRPRTASDALSTSTENIDPNGVSMFTVLEEQLGLKLEPATGPVEAIVIEHAELPNDN